MIKKNKKRIDPRHFLNETRWQPDGPRHGPGLSKHNIPSEIEWSDRQTYKSAGERENLENNDIAWLVNLLGDQFKVLDPNSPADVRKSMSGDSTHLLPIGKVGKDYWVKTGDGKYGVIKGYKEPPDWREEPDEDPWQASDYKPPYSE
jgi:hypothetical protein